MKMYKFSMLLIVSTLLIMTVFPARSQFVTLARKIKSKISGDGQESTVVLDAKTYKVYKAVIDTVTKVPQLKITKRDDSKRTIEYANGTNTISMKVDSLDTGYSKITVTAMDSGQPSPKTAEVTINAITVVCKKLGIKCTVDQHQ
jgi:hypothetical protein